MIDDYAQSLAETCVLVGRKVPHVCPAVCVELAILSLAGKFDPEILESHKDLVGAPDTEPYQTALGIAAAVALARKV